MAKKRGGYEDKMRLDLPFAEALERFAGTSPKEMHANIKRSKKRKPPSEKSKSPGDSDAQKVTKLSVRRVRKRNTGR
jgi:hypothetical protein